jgi:N6-adenosine-specific RNA methylase IME4
MQKHKFNFFPEIQTEEFDGLKNSIAKGFDTKLGKIILFENQILDGWNRYKACIEMGVEPVFENFVGNEQDAFEFSIKANQERRHLSKSQLAAVAIDAEPIWQAIQEKVEADKREKNRIEQLRVESEKREKERKEKERLQEQIRQENLRIEREKELALQKEREADLVKKQAIESEEKRIAFERAEADRLEKERKEKEFADKRVVPLVAQPAYEQNKSRTKLADTFGVGRTYIEEAKKLKATSPEKFEQVRSGEKSISEVTKELKIEKRQSDIQRQKEEIENGDLPELQGLFDVISVDPPWAYSEKGGFSYDQHDPDSNRGGVDYPTMTIEQIKAIELPLKDDSVVFLWTTHAFLRDAFDILDRWGLTYKATMVWDKQKMGMGRTIRLQCEFCLLAVKGKPLIEGGGVRDIISESRREHSRKPDIFFETVNKMTFGRRLEYFSREKRDGWCVFGNDINKF